MGELSLVFSLFCLAAAEWVSVRLGDEHMLGAES